MFASGGLNQNPFFEKNSRYSKRILNVYDVTVGFILWESSALSKENRIRIEDLIILSGFSIPYTVIGLFLLLTGIWLIRAPRKSKIGIFLGPMVYFRLLGILLILFGVLTFSVGLGLRKIGPFPIILH